jgi:hypothetical protein
VFVAQFADVLSTMTIKYKEATNRLKNAFTNCKGIAMNRLTPEKRIFFFPQLVQYIFSYKQTVTVTLLKLSASGLLIYSDQ